MDTCGGFIEQPCSVYIWSIYPLFGGLLVSSDFRAKTVCLPGQRSTFAFFPPSLVLQRWERAFKLAVVLKKQRRREDGQDRARGNEKKIRSR
jgi:hypothetical protein